jgi:hypothetical protein
MTMLKWWRKFGALVTQSWQGQTAQDDGLLKRKRLVPFLFAYGAHQPLASQRNHLFPEQPVRTSFVRNTLLVVLIGAALSFSPPVFGDDTDMLKKALDLVHQVENPAGNPPTDAQRIDLLTQAIALAQEAPNHRLKGHRVLAIQAIRGALAEIRSGDPNHKVAAFLQTADAEMSTSVSLASNTVSPQVEAPPPAAISTLTSTNTSSAPPSAAVPIDHGVASVPPEVTPDMEQAFLAKYKAALEKPDTDALFSMIAFDPNMDPKGKEALKGIYVLSFAMDASNPNRTYSFVPATSGPEDKPTELVGKMYGEYLPAVIALKITFGKPAHSSPDAPVATGASTIPLCIQDHQLMLPGLKEIPGAVPPPAVDKAANFGIEPNLRKVKSGVKDKEGFDDEGFTSLDEFLSSLKQPSVEILASGDSKYEYYAICCIAPNLCVFAGGDKVGEHNFTFYFKATDSNNQQLKGESTWIRLVDLPVDNGHAPNVQGTVFRVPDHYSGPVTVEAHYSDDSGKKSLTFSRTVDWK